MRKKYTILLLVLGIALLTGFMGFAFWRDSGTATNFEYGGFVLRNQGQEAQQLSFGQGDPYDLTISGAIRFETSEGNKVTIPRESFAFFDNSSIIALSDGVLLDFNDLSENFINNYYIPSGMPVTQGVRTYTAQTTAGNLEFGEHIWKLSDRMYLLQAPSLSIHFGKNEQYDAGQYVQISVSEDGVYYLQTQDGLWNTISPDCYIQTEGGVKVYPVSLLVDDGSYKLSMAKLAVSTEDAIVLTEAETRRQIVPILNIEAIDGEDGSDGGEGAAGAEGVDGKEGTGGKKGETGTQGGSLGKGEKGETGDNAGDTTIKSALPTMNITDWRLDGNSLRASIKITDIGYMLQLKNVDNAETRYPGSITITDVLTGESIATYNLGTSIDNTLDTTKTAFSFTGSNNASVHFAVEPGTLRPNREYQLSVNAYYKPDESNLIFSREFISRNFVTDTVGVSLSYEMATVDSVTVCASVSEDNGAQDEAWIYLMKAEDANAFDPNKSTTYLFRDEINMQQATNQSFAFVSDTQTKLTPNTAYVARVRVLKKDANGSVTMDVVTDQMLRILTLKTPPTWTGVPTASYTRTTGAFQVWRPTVTDPDKGVTKYVYSAYKATDKTKPIQSFEILPTRPEPVEFNLPSDVEYVFGVTMDFHDNNKTTTYDLGFSEPIKSMGGSLPTLSLSRDASATTEYNQFKGTLLINLANQTKLPDVSKTRPLKLVIRADQILEWTVVLESQGASVTLPGNNTVTLQESGAQTQDWSIALDLQSLKANQNYSITVYGYIDLDDDNPAVERALGTVTFDTMKMVKSRAVWSTPEDGANDDTYAFKCSLKLELYEENATDTTRADYARGFLTKGKTMIYLYRGESASGTPMSYYAVDNEQDLTKLYTTGLEMTNQSFGYERNELEAQTYSCAVVYMHDDTYNKNLGYVNDFGPPDRATFVITATPAPPQLSETLNNPMTATPIRNRDAASVQEAVREDLPGDAIIGYTMTSHYSNTQYLAQSITFYAFELYDFYSTVLADADPVLLARTKDPNSTALMSMTIDIDTAVPKAVVIFGGDPTTGATPIGNNTFKYYAGEAQEKAGGGGLASGMGRGYRYIFAYTLEYCTETVVTAANTKVYPDQTADYSSYCNSTYGGFTMEDGDDIVRVVAPQKPRYFLTSRVMDAPKAMPEFATYVYSTDNAAVKSDTSVRTEGTLHVHYRYRDADGLIINTGSQNDTKLFCRTEAQVLANEEPKESLAVIAQTTATAAHASGWYDLMVPFSVGSGKSTSLELSADLTGYDIDYDTLIYAQQSMSYRDGSYHAFSTLVVEPAYNLEWASNSYTMSVVPQFDKNYIKLVVNSNMAMRRAVALQVTLKPETAAAMTFTLPFTEDTVTQEVYAKLATSLLVNYTGEMITVTNAKLFYDTGLQGWNYGETGLHTVQVIGAENSEGEIEMAMGGYMNARELPHGAVPANAAMWEQKNGLITKLSTAFTTQTPQQHTFSYNGTLQSGYAPYLYPKAMGVSLSLGSALSSVQNRYIVPKLVESKNLSVNSENASFKMQSATPTVSLNNTYRSQTKIEIPPSGIVLNGVDVGELVYIDLWDQRESALYLNGTPKYTIILKKQADGSFACDNNYPLNDDDRYEFSALTVDTPYWLTFSMADDNDQRQSLLKQGDLSTALYEISTRPANNVVITEYRFNNRSYYNKEVSLKFSLAYYENQKVTYSLHTDAACETTALIDHNTLTKDGGLLTVSAVSKDMTAVLDLRPQEARALLLPGVTYYLKITAEEIDPSGANTGGTTIQPIRLDPTLGRYGANAVVVSNTVTTNKQNQNIYSMSFMVTMRDTEHTIMGAVDSTTAQSVGGLYAVRFFKTVGEEDNKYEQRLWTTHDNKVYSYNQLLKHTFVLDATTLNVTGHTSQTMDAATRYTMKVYAIADPNHSGSVTIGGVTLTPGAYFSAMNGTTELANDYEWGANFLKLIDGDPATWDTDPGIILPDGKMNAKKAELEKGLTLGSISASTLGSDGYFFNEEGISAVRTDSNRVRVELEGSYNLMSGTDSRFTEIEMQIVGDTASYQFEIDPATMYVSQNWDGYDVYCIDVPADLKRGKYIFTVHFTGDVAKQEFWTSSFSFNS